MLVSPRNLLGITLVACIVYPGAQSAFAQRPAFPPGQAVPGQPGVPGQQVVPGRPGVPNQTFDRGMGHDQNQLLQGSFFIGAPVMLQGGVSYGTLRDFVISNNGCIESAVIAVDNGLVAVPWGMGMFDVGRRSFVLDIGRDRIRDLPRIRDVAELRDPRIQQRVQTFYRGGDRNNMRGDQRGFENRPDNRQRGVENQPQHQPQHQPQPGNTNRGTAPTTPGTRGTGNEQRPANPPANQPEKRER
jgi:hypothetical protein